MHKAFEDVGTRNDEDCDEDDRDRDGTSHLT
jgi:hypothetical protein